MRGLIAAQHSGVANTYLNVVLAAMWEQGEKMDDPAVIERVMRMGGMDSNGLLTLTQSPEVNGQLLANTEAAVQRGVFRIPRFS
jgi:2-hydroxychromene-2-carboxylate isomerase